MVYSVLDPLGPLVNVLEIEVEVVEKRPCYTPQIVVGLALFRLAREILEGCVYLFIGTDLDLLGRLLIDHVGVVEHEGALGIAGVDADVLINVVVASAVKDHVYSSGAVEYVTVDVPCVSAVVVDGVLYAGPVGNIGEKVISYVTVSEGKRSEAVYNAAVRRIEHAVVEIVVRDVCHDAAIKADSTTVGVVYLVVGDLTLDRIAETDT